MDRFEQLARGVAGGMGRREALRWMGGGLAGLMLGALGGRRTGATTPNSECSKDCKNIYPPGGGNAYGQCVSNCEACANSGGGTCTSGFTNCEGASNCYCFATVEGKGFCSANSYCFELAPCSSSADCPTGYFCITSNGCTNCGNVGGVCAPPCSTNPFGQPQAAVAGHSSLTLIG